MKITKNTQMILSPSVQYGIETQNMRQKRSFIVCILYISGGGQIYIQIQFQIQKQAANTNTDCKSLGKAAADDTEHYLIPQRCLGRKPEAKNPAHSRVEKFSANPQPYPNLEGVVSLCEHLSPNHHFL